MALYTIILLKLNPSDYNILTFETENQIIHGVIWFGVWFVVFNATFNNISVIS